MVIQSQAFKRWRWPHGCWVFCDRKIFWGQDQRFQDIMNCKNMFERGCNRLFGYGQDLPVCQFVQAIHVQTISPAAIGSPSRAGSQTISLSVNEYYHLLSIPLVSRCQREMVLWVFCPRRLQSRWLQNIWLERNIMYRTWKRFYGKDQKVLAPESVMVWCSTVVLNEYANINKQYSY